MAATAARIGIPSIMTLVLARLFRPEMISVVGVYLMVVAIPLGIATLRLEDAVVLAKSNIRVLALIACSTRSIVATSICTSIATEVLRHVWLHELPPTAWLAAGLHIFGFGLWRLQSACFLYQLKLGKWALCDVAVVASLGVLQLVLAWIAVSPTSLIWALPLSYFCALILVAEQGSLRLATQLAARSTICARGWTSGRNFAIYLTPYSLLGAVRERATIGVLRSISPVAPGLFYQADRLLNMPSTAVTGALRPLVQLHGATGNSKNLRALVYRTTLLLAPAIGLGMGAIGGSADLVVRILFGPNWTSTAQYVTILTVPAALLAMTNWLDRLYHIGNGQRAAFHVELFGTITVTISTIIAGFATKSALSAVTAYSASMTVYLLVWWVWALRRGLNTAESIPLGLLILTASMTIGWYAGNQFQQILHI